MSSRYLRTTNPTSTDDVSKGYLEGAIWVNTSVKTVYYCVDNTASNAVWNQFSPSISVKLFWHSSQGDPTSGQTLNATLTGSSFWSYNTTSGIVTSAGSNSSGYVNWNVTGFDFTRDFKIKVNIGPTYSNGGDNWGSVVGFGSSSTGVKDVAANNGCIVQLNTAQKAILSYDASGVKTTSTFTSLTSVYDSANVDGPKFIHPYGHRGITIIVRKIGTKRMLQAYTKNIFVGSLNVTNWNPGGTYVFVGGFNATGYSNWTYCSHVSVEYI